MMVSPTPNDNTSGSATTTAAGPGSAVAVNFAGFTPPTCAVTLEVPALEPSVHVTDVTPRESVRVTELLVAPDPGATSHDTVAFDNSLPVTSKTVTESGTDSVAPTVPVCALPDAIVMEPGAPLGSVVPSLRPQLANNAAVSITNARRRALRVRLTAKTLL